MNKLDLLLAAEEDQRFIHAMNLALGYYGTLVDASQVHFVSCGNGLTDVGSLSQQALVEGLRLLPEAKQ